MKKSFLKWFALKAKPMAGQRDGSTGKLNMRNLLAASRLSSWLLLMGASASLVTGIALMRPDLFGAQHGLAEDIHVLVPLIFAPPLLVHVLAGLLVSVTRNPNRARIVIAVQLLIIFVLGIVTYLALWSGDPSSQGIPVSGPTNGDVFSGTEASATPVVQPTATSASPRKPVNVGLTLEEVARHSSPDDCWIVVGGEVYDVTQYLPLHPAGASIVVPFCGKDATNVFLNTHSTHAYTLLERYHIGSVENATLTRPGGAVATPSIPRPIDAVDDPISAVLSMFPGAEIMKVEREDGYIYEVELIYGGGFYEVKVDAYGNLLEVEEES